MFYFLLKRLFLFITVAFGILFFIFTLVCLFPQNKLTSFSGIDNPTIEQRNILTKEYSLDKGFLSQFLSYSKKRLEGDFGLSLKSKQSVFTEFKIKLTYTLELALIAWAFALVIGLFLGFGTALSHNDFFKNIVLFLSLVGISVPIFWFGMLLISFGNYFDVYSFNANKPGKLLYSLLPVITLAIYPFSIIVRISYRSMKSVIQTNYISAAKARGLSNWRILVSYAIPNAMHPVLKILGLSLGPFISVLVLVEVVFSYPGIGSWLALASKERDYTVISGVILMLSWLLVLFTMLIDSLHAYFNPKSRENYDT